MIMSLSAPEFNEQLLQQWICDCLLIKFTWYEHAKIYESDHVPVCKAGLIAMKIMIT